MYYEMPCICSLCWWVVSKRLLAQRVFLRDPYFVDNSGEFSCSRMGQTDESTVESEYFCSAGMEGEEP